MAKRHTIVKHDREMELCERKRAKAARRQERRRPERHLGQPSNFDPTIDQFPSAWPDAPELLDGVARTLSRGME